MSDHIENPNRLQKAYEFDELNMPEETVTITIHRSILRRMGDVLVTFETSTNFGAEKAIRSIGHNLRKASEILHGKSSGTDTVFDGLITDGN